MRQYYLPFPGSRSPADHSLQGFSLANNTTGSLYDVIAENPERAVRFANAMKVMTSKPEFDLCYGTDYYDWASLGEAQVVDVGGAKGHFAMALARRYSKLRIVVQDMANVVENADVGDLRERVRFMAHDLFDRQTICADVFFFRWIFHNWSDQYCIRILKAQVPALKSGARLIVQEAFMPETGTVARWKERDFRYVTLYRQALKKRFSLTLPPHTTGRWIWRWPIPSTLERGRWPTGRPCLRRPTQHLCSRMSLNLRVPPWEFSNLCGRAQMGRQTELSFALIMYAPVLMHTDSHYLVPCVR